MRMLWGKAVLQWTPNAAECLRVLEHLNNKYSLDGRDPNSYGGIMWTFGKFDRPFYRRPIYGTVRYQSLRAAEQVRRAALRRHLPAYWSHPLGPEPQFFTARVGRDGGADQLAAGESHDAPRGHLVPFRRAL